MEIEGYVELASAQLLDNNWRELSFDIASVQNILQDLVCPESGGGYVYKDASAIGSATQNRFLYWRTARDILELIEISPEILLDGNQVRIKFSNSPVISSISVLEQADSIVIMVATSVSVHRWDLPHPKTTNKSILSDLTSELLFNPSNYYILNNQGLNTSQQPICATSWADESTNQLKCALSLPSSSILIVQFSRDTHHITTSEIKQIGIMGRIWSRMPNLLARSANDCDNAVYACSPFRHHPNDDVLLIALCRDWKIRIFSTNSRECVHTYSIIPQNSFSQSFSSHTNPTTEQPMMRVFESHVFIYINDNRPEFVILEYSFEDGQHRLREEISFEAPNWERLLDFSVSKFKIWALANLRGTESTLHYIDLRRLFEGHETGDFVRLVEDLELPVVRNHVAQIFWRNRFSDATIGKALAGLAGQAITNYSIEALQRIAFTSITDDDQKAAWNRFYDYCLQNHHCANRNIGLVVGHDESVISIVKRSNPSFVIPWPMDLDLMFQNEPYRGIKSNANIRSLIEPLNYIFNEYLSEEISDMIEQQLFERPAQILDVIDKVVNSLMTENPISSSKMNYSHKKIITSSIQFICDQLDLSFDAGDFSSRILEQASSMIQSEHNPLESNSGIIMTFEHFKRLVRARMILARDLLVYVRLAKQIADSDESTSSGRFLVKLCAELESNATVRRICDLLRCYAVLVWISESPIETYPIIREPLVGVVESVASQFQFFKSSSDVKPRNTESSIDSVLCRNLLMSFLVNGGVEFTGLRSSLGEISQTVSNSFYVSEMCLNLCKILWPKSNRICFAEFLFTHHLDEHLSRYLDLTCGWLSDCEYDRYFLKAMNCLFQNRTTDSVSIINRLWVHLDKNNLVGRLIGYNSENVDHRSCEKISINPATIYHYYDRMIQLFQLYNNPRCLVMLINHCMTFLDENSGQEQQNWVNCFRAKLFRFYLDLEEPDEAYDVMVLMTDPLLRVNCLRKFIVSHCEKEQWASLLSYPFIDIRNEFIDILNQKAEGSDLSKLNGIDFHKTTYYDLLFASYISDDDFKRGANVMYSYAQRLAHEVPGVVSIKKQADCLLIALNALRCVPSEDGAYLGSDSDNTKDEGRFNILKRAHDGEHELSIKFELPNESKSPTIERRKIGCNDLEMKHELTLARLKLLEKDQRSNAIALSPLKPEETIAHLVASSMFGSAIDLALLFRAPMDLILEGLTSKYVSVMSLTAFDLTAHPDIDTDIFRDSYSNIDTYNSIADSTSPFVERLWRLIDHLLTCYDGVGHRYESENISRSFSGTTVLMRIVAVKILSAGCHIPGSLRRLYLMRNTSELLKLLIKYDRLLDAAELAHEMVDKVVEIPNCLAFTSPFATSHPPAVYLPTHLIILLIEYLKEDATDTVHIKVGEVLSDKLKKYRQFVQTS